MSWDEYEYGDKKARRSALLDDECVKCGSFDNTYRFHEYCDSDSVEHIHYSCYSCGYSWNGQTVEQMRDKSGYFDKATYKGFLSWEDWSDWDEYNNYVYEDEDSAIPDDYEPSLSKYGPILSER